MSRIHWFLAFSLAANLVLAALWWQQSSARLAAETPAPDSVIEPAAADASAALSKTTPNSAINEPSLPAASDLDGVHRHLVAAGFPRPLITRIIAALANQQVSRWFAARALSNDSPDEYWKSRPGAIQSGTPEMQEYYERHRDGLRKLVEILGPAYLDDLPARAGHLRHSFGPLPAAKLARVEELKFEYDQKRHEPASSGKPETSEERERRLDAELRTALAAVLTPNELLEYELRASSTAETLRRDYALAELSEDEFRRLFQFIRPVEQQLGSAYSRPSTTAARAARTQAEAALFEQMKVQFGTGRASELALMRDPTARQETELTAQLNLPLATAVHLVSIRDDVQAQVRTLHQDQNLTPQERSARITTLLADAEQRFTTTLGKDGFARYRESGGQWLKRLQPQPSPEAP